MLVIFVNSVQNCFLFKSMLQFLGACANLIIISIMTYYFQPFWLKKNKCGGKKVLFYCSRQLRCMLRPESGSLPDLIFFFKNVKSEKQSWWWKIWKSDWNYNKKKFMVWKMQRDFVVLSEIRKSLTMASCCENFILESNWRIFSLNLKKLQKESDSSFYSPNKRSRRTKTGNFNCLLCCFCIHSD